MNYPDWLPADFYADWNNSLLARFYLWVEFTREGLFFSILFMLAFVFPAFYALTEFLELNEDTDNRLLS